MCIFEGIQIENRNLTKEIIDGCIRSFNLNLSLYQEQMKRAELSNDLAFYFAGYGNDIDGQKDKNAALHLGYKKVYFLVPVH